MSSVSYLPVVLTSPIGHLCCLKCLKMFVSSASFGAFRKENKLFKHQDSQLSTFTSCNRCLSWELLIVKACELMPTLHPCSEVIFTRVRVLIIAFLKSRKSALLYFFSLHFELVNKNTVLFHHLAFAINCVTLSMSDFWLDSGGNIFIRKLCLFNYIADKTKKINWHMVFLKHPLYKYVG